MVDDLSTAVKGDFSNVRKMITLFSEAYPDSMPLNIQISFGYSRFLDMHIFKNLKNEADLKMTTSLAYKPLARFEYVPYHSNISSRYKGCVVSSFLNRVHRRCTEQGDRRHHVAFFKTILRYRQQNCVDVKKKFRKFYQNAKNLVKVRRKRIAVGASSPWAMVTYDRVSRIHKITQKCIMKAYHGMRGRMPLLVHRSLPKVMSHLESKRKLMRKVKQHMNV